MTTRISSNNLDATVTAQFGPKISGITVTNNSYTNLDDTAVDTAGGFIKLAGTGFVTGCQVLINNVPATSTTFVSATEVRAQVPATAAGTYVVYLVNADGGVAIRLNGITFSATPVWVTGSALSGDSDTAISIQLSATGASTYAVAAGSTLPAGLTLSSAGLLAGTVTGLVLETVYNFTVNAIDAELQDSPRSFAITISTGDPQIRNVSALLSPQLEVAPFNRDASTNNFAVTVFGDTRPNSFGPYTPGYYSNYFDGTGDFLSVPDNAALDLGSTDYTIEGWWYFTDTSNQAMVSKYTGNNGYVVQYQSNNLRMVLGLGSTDAVYSFAWTAIPNTWNHVAITRSATNGRAFINGVQIGSTTTFTTSNTVGATALQIGSTHTVSELTRGYVSNFRLVKGTAVYTANFTPPITPLTAIANTSFLTCQSNQFVDNSTNNFAITRNGDVRIDGFDPFVPATEFAGRGSTYFAGGSSYVTAPVTASNGDLTIECWIYPTATTSPRGFVFTSGGNDSTAWAISYNTNNTLGAWIGSYGGAAVNSTNTIPLNNWGHVAIVKTSGTVYMYVNGVRSSAVSQPGVFGSTTNVHIATYNAGAGTQSFVGYVSNFRYVDGTALYTAATVALPTAPLTAVTGTRLLTLQNNQPHNNNQFLDSSTNNFLVTRTGNTTQGTFSPYGGGWSNYFDGGATRLQIPSATALDAGAGDFCIECWFLGTADYNSYTVGYANLAGKGSGNVSGTYAIAVYQGKLYSGLSGTLFSGTTTLAVGVWYHGAVTRSGSTVRLFLNGVLEGTATNTTDFTSSSNFAIGDRQASDPFNQYPFKGYISNVRLVKGNAVYTTNFTPPSAPLQPIAGTSLLTCADNRFIDDSANNFAITRTGGVSVEKFNPFGLINASGVKTVYTPAVYGGSISFDGTGDMLTVNSFPGPLTGNFTYEAWVYPTSSALSYRVVFGIDNYAGGQPFRMYQYGTNFQFWYTGSAGNFINSGTIAINQWYHLAVSRSGTSIRFFVNGTQVGTTLTSSANYPNSIFRVGLDSDGSSYPFIGYISDVRVGNTAHYTSNFVPPAVPLTPVTNTTLLLSGTGAAVRDASMSNNLETVGDARTATNITRYGNTSVFFDGSGDYLTIPNSPGMAFGTSNFTLECWIYIASPNDSPIYEGRSTGASTAGFTLTAFSSTVIRIFSGSVLISATVANYANTWTHVAVVRNSGTTTLYVNGISGGTTTSLGTMTNSQPLIGGGRYSSDNSVTASFNGLISDFRITNGVARYTANFTPPAAASKTK